MFENFEVPIGDWVEVGVQWIQVNLNWLLEFIKTVIGALVEGVGDGLIATPIPVVILIAAALCWLFRSWQLAIGTIVMFFLIVGMGQWENAMLTLALVIIATLVAVLLSVPLGIWSARNATVRAILKPVLDLMQTMPAFVYLIPAIVFFGIGFVPGVIATVIFSMPPGVRLTELGIRGVDAETVEAGQAFGAGRGQILRGIQLPLAVPTIMAGVNQVIMLSLSMAVIAGMAGADGLGKEVTQAINTVDIPQGVNAGLGIVFLAVFLDRITAALGTPSEYPASIVGRINRRRAAQRNARIDEEAAAKQAELVEAAGPRRAGP